MLRRLALITALGTLGALGICDQGEILIVPEFDLAFGFDAGLEGWVPAADGLGTPPATWSVAVSTETTSSGAGALKMRLDDPAGAGRVWIERGFDVAPSQPYDVVVSFHLGSADHAGVTAWSLLSGSRTDATGAASDLAVTGDTGNASATDQGVLWVERADTLRAVSDEEGRVYLMLGVGATTPGARAYFFDDVRVLFTRAGF